MSTPDRLPGLTIAQLEYLVAASRHRTWAEAADALAVTPSALSQGLAELERRIGVPLFERDGRQRRLSSGARQVLDYAEEVLAATSSVAAWAGRVQQGKAGRLRVGMIDAAAIHHFAPDLARFRAERADVEVRLHVAPSGELLAALARGELDLVVAVEPPVTTGALHLEVLLDEPLWVYAPPGTGPRDDAWVLFPTGSHTRAVVQAALARSGTSVDVVAESNQPEVLRAMVRLGLGRTVLPASQAGSPAEGLVAEGDAPLCRRRLVLARRHSAVTDPATEALCELLRSRTGSRREPPG